MRVFDASDLSSTDYYYERNLQGDIIAITNAYGGVLGRYTYGAWGEMLYVRDANYSSLITDPDHIANINALRYRGYIYDTETGLYYLGSRYYDPIMKRFVNANEVIDSGSLAPNMFAYCANNPMAFSATSSVSTAPPISKNTKTDFHIPEYDSSRSFRYDVPLYNQNGYNLCWAFCQVMVEDYKTRITRTKEKAEDRAIQIAITYHGASGIEDRETWDKSGWPTDVVVRSVPNINSINSLHSALIKYGPLYACYGDPYDFRHLIVVTGVNLTKGLIYTNNPWGVAGEQTYAQFLRGFVNMPREWNMPFEFYLISQQKG